MRSRMIALVACVTLATPVWAGDPWKEKTYKEWTEQDINKILSDSPWARPVTVNAFWRASGDSTADSAGSPPASGETAAGSEGPAPKAPSTTENRGGGEIRQASYILRWGSMRTVREALARLAILKGTPEAEVEKRLNAPVTAHQFVLYGADMSPFAKMDEMSLLQRTSLKLKKSKQKISPVRVEIARSQDGKRIAGISFFFPMKTEAGQPVIAADEKGVDFECRSDIVTIRQSFDLQKMVGKSGPDLQ